MDWQKYYKERLVSAEEAISHIKPGDTVVTSHAASNPKALFDALYDNREAYEGNPVSTVHMIGWGVTKHVEPGAEKYFHHNSIYVGGPEREAVAAGRADYTPIYFSKIPSLFLEGYINPDVALLEMSTPDSHGYCSFGVTVDYAMAAAKSSKLVIALINSTMPRTHGDCFIHVSDIDYFVETDEPICELPSPKITHVEEAIGEHCASMVEDGATLQLGIGSLPDALLKFLTKKKDLGIHSEMFSDGVVDLIESGVINNKLKTLHPGKSVATFLMGTRKLYDYVDDNPGVYMAPVSYTNDPYIIAQNRKMVSINACVQVDLMGQVCSESVGLRQISAVGGQVDFVRGVNLAPDGISIIATPSTTKDGKTSKIVPFLDEGATVTTNRFDVENIVTEYGIANLRNVTLRERSRRLISIAHPSFRPMLIEEYERRYKQKFQK